MTTLSELRDFAREVMESFGGAAGAGNAGANSSANSAGATAGEGGWRAPFAFGLARVSRGAGGKALKADFALINARGEADITAAIMLWALREAGTKISFKGGEFVAKFGRRELDLVLEKLDFLADEAVGDAHKNLQVFMAASNALDAEFGECGECGGSENSASGGGENGANSGAGAGQNGANPNAGGANSNLDDSCGSFDTPFSAVFLWEDAKPASVEAVYAKLYLLSSGKAAVRSLNLDGAFGLLPNLAWDYFGECYELDELRANEIALKMNGTYPAIAYVDKFPRYLSCVVPPQSVRVLDAAKVRMGAVLGSGTTVMPGAAYINFNAGTSGAVMVEGRVSSSVSVGEGSDVGGGASILGVLSGTNGNPITIGKRCLLGANSVTGVPLGDDCIVDAGVAVLEGTKVYVAPEERKKLAALNGGFAFDKEIYKALELAGLNGLHYRQESQTGRIIVALSRRAIKLNAQLH